jgi:hypothetical protein
MHGAANTALGASLHIFGRCLLHPVKVSVVAAKLMCVILWIVRATLVLGAQRGYRVGSDHPESCAAHLGDIQLQEHLDCGNRPWGTSTTMVSELMLAMCAHEHHLMLFAGTALMPHIPLRCSGEAQMAGGGHSGWDRRGALQSAGPASWLAT